MKFSFKIQQYQTDAVDAVARVFQGQPYNAGVSYLRDMGSLSAQPQQLSLVSNGDDATQVELQDLINDSGFKNEALQLTDQELLQNIRTLQAEANIHQSDKLVAPLGRCSLDIEMETGTGKTYVYIKTMFELNKRYGWSKFIVVVPSIAIREGVKKSFEITADHFMECYGKKARFFIYNSSNLNQLDSFSSNSGINVMIINSQAFNARGKDARRIYMKLDEFRSRRPIDIIAKTNPILIIDEPQSVEGKQTKERMKEFNPMITLRYSATHRADSIYNMVYRLDAMEAYNKRLVKKIVVKALDPLHGKMLQKIGADKVIYSEKEMGVRVAHNLISPGIVDYIEMENNITILSIHVPEDWIGKSILDIDIRKKYNITVVAIKRKGEMYVNPHPDMQLASDDMLIILGDSESVKRVTASLEQ